MKQKSFILIFFLLHQICSFSQGSIRLTLDDALELAGEQSLQTFLNKHYYMADYWAYRSYRADYLPSVNLQATPLNYSNASQLRYNSSSRTDEFIRTETLRSDLNLNVSQKVALTGGTFFVQSELGRIENFGLNEYTQYSSRPFRIGYNQELFGFNAMKWQRKIEPLKFEKAKLEYLQSTENMHLTTVRHYFGLLSAHVQMEIARGNISNTENLLQVANRRFELGTVTREELLDLRLSHNNAIIDLQQAKLNHREAKENLLNFLMLPIDVDVEVFVPENIPVEEIDVQKVLEKALANNPEILQLEQNILEGQRNVEQANRARHFSADVNLSYGISKDDGFVGQNGSLSNVYSPEFDNYQQVRVGVNIPILDWGRNRGQYEMAKSRYHIAQVASQQSLQQFNQNAVTRAITFNIQKSRLESAALSDTLANESYELTMTRFKNGQVDVLRLTSSQRAKDNARLQYINALSEYWNNYFYLRRLTLYDFAKNEDIVFNEDELLNIR
ncbi:TolC family protein [Natronoflexus pectinivorans]|uniref:Outer membrane protein TolC n=1 Tax=Natronoflexus pectinivorans TaxID=682526 RepID=A0A4R2G9H1_9BACT|nr:TolC family protein [Natronoflexus pectinivorans]TCO04423.1 outer membrane protein TolC [Natronoflexus pectinivorans]